MASASSTRNHCRRRRLSGKSPTQAPGEKGRMKRTSVPKDASCVFTLRFSPSMIETIAMIDVMPMMTPSTVRKERSLLARIAWKAMPTPSRTSIATPLLLPQRHDRIELRGARGGIDAEEEADRGGHDEAERDRPGLDGGRKRRRRADEERDRDAGQDAEDPAEQRQDHRLAQELHREVGATGAQRLPDADLARALRDGDEHDVHDDD